MSLSRKKNRDRLGQCVIEGFRSVDAALQAGIEPLDVLVDASFDGELPVGTVLTDARTLSKMANTTTSPGILAVVPTRLANAADLEALDRILVLDGVQDPGNVGTLIRTAAWFGVDAVVAGPDTADFFNPKTLRASMGGMWDVAVARVDDTAAYLQAEALRRAVWIADMDGISPGAWHAGDASALVMGSEAHGVDARIRALATGAVSIPGSSARRGVESLNVAAAGAILMAAWRPR